MKNELTARLADAMIGAAQILERQARELKSQAKTIREHGLAGDNASIVRLFAMHKRTDVENAARAATADLAPLEGATS